MGSEWERYTRVRIVVCWGNVEVENDEENGPTAVWKAQLCSHLSATRFRFPTVDVRLDVFYCLTTYTGRALPGLDWLRSRVGDLSLCGYWSSSEIGQFVEIAKPTWRPSRYKSDDKILVWVLR